MNATLAPEPTPRPRTIPGNGTLVVGRDIEPGTYRSKGPANSVIPWCGWQRLADTSGAIGSVVAIDNSAGPVTFTVAATDVAVKVTNCAPFKRLA